jgi:hypothetical protein
MKVYFLWSVEGILIGVFSAKLTAADFIKSVSMLEGWWLEETLIDHPNILLKKGTY